MFDKIFTKNNFLRNYMFSSMVILLVPIIITGLFMYSYFAQKIRDEALRGVYLNLTQVRDINDMRVNVINNTSYQIIYNNKIKSLFYTENLQELNIFSYYQAIEELKKFRSSNLFIDNIYLYFTNENIVISEDSKYSKEGFWGYIFNQGSLSARQMDTFINDITETTVVSSQYWDAMRKPGDTVLFMYPQPIVDLSYKAVLIISVDADSIRSLMNETIEQFDGMFVMRDEKGAPLVSTFNSSIHKYVTAEVSALDTWYTQKLEGADYFVLNVNSKETDYYYSVYIRSSLVMKSFYMTCLFIIIIIITCIMGGFLIAYRFAYVNYLPIKNILDIINTTNLNEDTVSNEYDRIAIAIKSYLSDNEQLNRRIIELQPVVYTNYLKKLLQGSFVDISAFSELNKKLYNLPFDPPYCVILFKIDKYEINADSEESFLLFAVRNVTEEMALTIGAGYTVILENGNIAAIITLNEALQQNISELCEKIQSFLSKHLSIYTTAGIGNIYHETFDISKSFTEASTDLENRSIKEKDGIKTEDVLAHIHKHYDDPNYSLSLVAESFHVSSAYMSQFIKSRTGQSYVDYVHTLRLEKAKELLRTEDLTLAEVAEKSGYNDSHSLIRIFKKYLGVTPGKYREIEKNKEPL